MKKKDNIVLIDTIKAYSNDLDDPIKLQRLKPKYEYHHKLIYEIKNLHFVVHLYPDKNFKSISFSGSIPKFILGHNVRGVSVIELKKGIRKIKTLTGIDVSKFVITRLDLAMCLDMSHPVEYYLREMDYYPKYNRIRYSKTSIAFKTETGIKHLKFYDKKKELLDKKKFKTLSKFNSASNLLRVEYMNNGSVTDDYGRKLKVSDLLKPSIHSKFKPLIIHRFKKIKFTKTLKLKDVDRADQYINYLTISGLQNEGGLDKFYQLLKSSVLTKSLNKSQALKTKRILKKILAIVPKSKISNSRKELLKKLKEFSTILPTKKIQYNN